MQKYIKYNFYLNLWKTLYSYRMLQIIGDLFAIHTFCWRISIGSCKIPGQIGIHIQISSRSLLRHIGQPKHQKNI